ncbi:hypothetical protein P389DRAFT_16490 [Cystobasidium minutum MCA 4210]|uniref:uncharacterized protein n=1 Tax=Cystobasidium minutum MCA 4210 TaxID=1397322 RepID=UPI0034CFB54D|eukprot:jgi/Rhomi1/16490/CE16489_1515
MADALATAVHNLESLLHPTPPSGYKARFWIQVVLNSILLLICLIYLVVAYAESRRLRKPLALLRTQRVASGRFIVVNALVLLVLFDGFATALMLVLRYKLYTVYFGTGNPRDKLVIAVQGWSPITLVAWAYSFGNIAAMMQIKTRDFGGPSKRAIFFYNLAFVSSLVIAFGLGIPFCLIANTKMNTLIRTGEDLLKMVHASQSTRTPFTPAQMQIIRSLLLTIKECQDGAAFWVRAVLILAGSISCLTAFSAAASFWFVAFLSEFPKINSPEASARSPTLVNASIEHEITFLGLGAPENHVPSSQAQPRSPRISKTSKATFGSSRPQNVALKRLSKDLMLSVPVVLVLSVYCMWGRPSPYSLAYTSKITPLHGRKSCMTASRGLA